jgi:hypothetical protein
MEHREMVVVGQLGMVQRGHLVQLGMVQQEMTEGHRVMEEVLDYPFHYLLPGELVYEICLVF